MNGKVTIEIDPQHEALVRRTLALAQELEQLALTAPDGSVFDSCETAVVHQGRKLQRQMLAEAVTRRVAEAEKKGRRCEPVRADISAETAGPSNAPS
jgi:hypothetical protein